MLVGANSDVDGSSVGWQVLVWLIETGGPTNERACYARTLSSCWPFWYFAAGAASVVSAFWLAVFFPAHMSPDSMSQWGQAVSWKPTDWHPIGMTLIMRAVHLLCSALSMQNQIAVVAWLQGTLFWFSIFAIFGMATLRLGVKLLACLGLILYYPLWPYTVTLWKDVWFSMAILWLVWYVYRARLEDWPLWRLGFSLFPVLLAAMLNRHTALFSFVFLSVLITPTITGFARQHVLWRCLFWISVALLAIGFQKLLYRCLHVEYAGSITNGVALFELAGTVHFAGMNEPEWRRLRSSHDLGEHRFAQVVRLYRCGATADYLVFLPGHPLEPSDVLERRSAITDLMKLAWIHPIAYFRQRGCSVLRLLGVEDERVYYPFHDGIWPNEFGIHESSVWQTARDAVFLWERASTKYLPIRWPFRHYLLLLASGTTSFLVLLRPRLANRYLVWYLFAAGVAVLFPLLLVTPARDWRYLMPADVCWAGSVVIAAASWMEAAFMSGLDAKVLGGASEMSITPGQAGGKSRRRSGCATPICDKH
jgi:hypothetical protein